MRAAWSMPYFHTAILPAFHPIQPALVPIPVTFPSVPEANRSAPTTRIHFVNPEIALDCQCVLLGQNEEYGSILLNIFWVYEPGTRAGMAKISSLSVSKHTSIWKGL